MAQNDKTFVERAIKTVIFTAANVLARMSVLPRSSKRWLVVGIDAALLMISVWLAYSLRLGEWSLFSRPILTMIGICGALAFPLFYFLKIYRVIFRYAGVGMLFTLARAFVFYTIATVVIFLAVGLEGIPRTMGFLQPLVFFALVCLSRIMIRYVMTDVIGRGEAREERRTVLIYGAGLSAQALLRSLREDPSMNFVGFIVEDHGAVGQTIDGAKVWHSDDLGDVITRFGVTDVLLAMERQKRRKRRALVEKLNAYPVTVRYLPNAKDIISGNVSISDIRPIAIEDLLGREPVAPKPALLERAIKGKVVMVTGAGGSIGSELARQIYAYGARQLILFENSELALYSIDRELNQKAAEKRLGLIEPVLGSVLDQDLVDEVFARYAIDTVFHAAAYKHVPLIEANPMQGIRNNILGTLMMAQAAFDAKVGNFILVSTDKAVRPTNIMGATKRAAEQVVQALAARSEHTIFSMTRFGNVLGSSGSVVPLFKDQIARGGPVTITHKDVTRYFMTIPEAANLVIQSSGMAKGGEVFVLDMGEPVKIVDLARNMVRLSGLTVRDDTRPEGDIEIRETGLRPGEKLYEELLIGEDVDQTQHERIMMAHEGFLPWPELSTMMERLAGCRDVDAAIAMVHELVPDLDHRRDNEAEIKAFG